MNDGDTTVRALVLDWMVDVTNVTFKRMTNGKEMTTERTLVPKRT